VADYLEWYAEVFDLPVRSSVRVNGVRRVDNSFEVTTSGTTLEAENVIVATGPFQTPRVPAFASQLDAATVQLHSSQYKRPAQLPEGDVLVVGAGNSGAQIALELARTRNVVLAGRSVGSLPRRVRIRRNVLGSSDALIGMTEKELLRGGVRRAGRVTGVVEGKPQLANGETLNVSAIVWCTGFTPDFSWIDAPVFNANGFPIHHRGATAVQGLYFLGQRFLNKLNSSLIGGVGADAEHLAGLVAARYGDTRALSAPASFSGKLETAAM
jgi:putative flavoprotein involved in K+ transport